jgi:hypothetical protein
MRNTSSPVAADLPEPEVAVIDTQPGSCVDGAGTALVADMFHEGISRMQGEMRLYVVPPKISHGNFESIPPEPSRATISSLYIRTS